MSIDHRQFGPRGPTSKGTADQQRRWWTLPPDQAADSISSVVTLLRDNQHNRQRQYEIGARLYGNAAVPSIGIGTTGRDTSIPPQWRDRISFNVVQSVVDTLASKITKNRPRPLFLTDNGDWQQKRRAQKLTKFMDGVFYENDAYLLGTEAFRDAGVWGDGLIHVFERDGRVALERVVPSEIVIDEIEALHAHPRQMHRVKQVDRDVLADLFPGHRAAIEDADDAKIDQAGAQARASELVTVRESWHLPSSKGAKDGAHIITIDGCALTKMEPWTRDTFPFARFRWSPRLYGYWSQGAAERLQGIQLEINKLLRVIQHSYHLGGSFKLFLPNGSKVAKEHLNNEIGSVITGDKPPQYVVPPLVPPEMYRHLVTLIQRAFEQEGVSQLSATSQKPAGLNSGKALREYNDIETERFMVMGQAYERLFIDVAHLSIAVAKEISDRGDGYPVRVPGRQSVEAVDWKDIGLDEDQYVTQCFPVSSLPHDPAGRLQTVQEYAQAGYLEPRQAKRLLDFPDLAAVESLQGASEDWIEKTLDAIVDDGVLTEPDPFDDLALAREMALEYYQRGKTHGLSEDRLELLRRYIGRIDWLQEQAMKASQPPPPPAGAAPPAPPVPPTPSDLVPNVPMQGLQ